MFSRPISIALAVCLLMSVGCTAIEDKSTAENVMSNYFAAIEHKDFDKALDSYAPQFFEKTPREEWHQALENINAKLGDLQQYELTSWRIQLNSGLGPNGTSYIFHYNVTYSKSSADEQVTLFKPSDTNEIKIVQHQINSAGFLK